MPVSPTVLAITALIALAAGAALSFFELILLGIALAIAALALWLKRRPTRGAARRA